MTGACLAHSMSGRPFGAVPGARGRTTHINSEIKPDLMFEFRAGQARIFRRIRRFIGRDTRYTDQGTCTDSIFQTFGFQGADVISIQGW